MKRLPLFPGGMPPTAIELAGPLDRNPNCARCALGTSVHVVKRCLPPAGEAGGLMTVGLHPGSQENVVGIPNCLVPETLVLMADLTWRELGNVDIGDKVISIDAEAPQEGTGVSGAGLRNWRIATITNKMFRTAPAYRVETNRGVLIGSGDHPVFTINKLGKSAWCEIHSLITSKFRPSAIGFVVEPWVKTDSYDAGWLAGFFDGEGHVSGSKGKRKHHIGVVGFSQNMGPIRDHAVKLLQQNGFRLRQYEESQGRFNIIAREFIAGGVIESLRFLGTIRPDRLIADYLRILENRRVRGLARAIVENKRQIGNRDLIDITTTSGTFIANGFVVHNCGPTGRYLHTALKKRWSGPIAHANAVNCFNGPHDAAIGIDKKHVEKCRPYVRRYLEDVKPTRVLALGGLAVASLLGRDPGVRSVRRGFSWVRLPHGRVPVMILMHPASLDGRFAKAAWESDLDWALSTPDSFLNEAVAELESTDYAVVASLEEAREAARELRMVALAAGKPITWDVEARGRLHDPDFKIISIAAWVRSMCVVYVWDRAALEAGFAAPFWDLVDDPELLFAEQGSYDERASLCERGLPIAGGRHDIRLMRKLLDCAVPKADLDTLSYLVGAGGYKDAFDEVLAAARKTVKPASGKRGLGVWSPNQGMLFDDCPDPYARQKLYEIYSSGDRKRIDEEEFSYLYALVPSHELSKYNARDVVGTGLLHDLLWPQIRADEGLARLWDEVTEPASRSYTRAEDWGVPMSREAISALIAQARASKKQLEPRLRAHLSSKYKNIELGSRDQVAEFIYAPPEFGGLGLPVPKETKGGKNALDKEARAELAGKHPFIDLYNAFTALDGDVEKGEEFARFIRSDGRVHPSILLDGAETGRPSCLKPNLYNLKRPEDCEDCRGKGCAECEFTGTDEDSRRIRSCFAAPDDFEILEADLSQIELRGIGIVTGDDFLTRAFIQGKDLHAEAAAEASRKTGFTIERQDAKPIDFGIAYGLTVMTLEKRLKQAARQKKKPEPSSEHCAAVFDAVMGLYPGVTRTKNAMLREARRTGYTYNIWQGRRAQLRPLWDLDSRDGSKRHKAENGIFNTLIQGSFSGLLVLDAHARLVDFILRQGWDHLWQPVCCVYDSIIAVVHKSLVPLAARVTVDVMTSREIGKLPDGKPFPTEADCKRGKTLGVAKKYKPPKTYKEALAECEALGLRQHLNARAGYRSAAAGATGGA